MSLLKIAIMVNPLCSYHYLLFTNCKYCDILKKNVYIYRPHGKESTEVRKSQIMGKESENSYQKLKRSLKDRHMQTQGNCIEIFQQARPSLSIDAIKHLLSSDW